MEFPYKFPSEVDVIAEAAERQRGMTIGQILDRLFAMVDFGQSLLKIDPNNKHAMLRDESERQWIAAHQEAYRHHGC